MGCSVPVRTFAGVQYTAASASAVSSLLKRCCAMSRCCTSAPTASCRSTPSSRDSVRPRGRHALYALEHANTCPQRAKATAVFQSNQNVKAAHNWRRCQPGAKRCRLYGRGAAMGLHTARCMLQPTCCTLHGHAATTLQVTGGRDRGRTGLGPSVHTPRRSGGMCAESPNRSTPQKRSAVRF